MKKAFFKIIAFILGFFLNSCDQGFNSNEMILEYGIPTAKYKISGYVQNDQNTPIEGIKIVFQDYTTSTNPDGSFSIDENILPCQDCKLTVEDIDGPDNGGDFQTKEVDLNLTETEGPSDNWDQGTFEQHDIEINLDEK